MATFLRKAWRQKPPESWQINWGHPLADGLVAFITADGDHVSGRGLKLVSSSDKRLSDGRFVVASRVVASFPALAPTLKNEITAISFCAVSGYDDWGAFFSIPYRNDTSWSSPYCALLLGHYYDGHQLRLMFSNGSTASSYYSDASLVSADNIYSCYAIRKYNNGISFYKDGAHYSTWHCDSGYTFDNIPNFVNKAPLTIGSRSSTAPGEGIRGVYGPQLLYARCLSRDELQAVNENPWQIFQPQRLIFPLATASVPTTNVTATTAFGAFVVPSAAATAHPAAASNTATATVAACSGTADASILATPATLALGIATHPDSGSGETTAQNRTTPAVAAVHALVGPLAAVGQAATQAEVGTATATFRPQSAAGNTAQLRLVPTTTVRASVAAEPVAIGCGCLVPVAAASASLLASVGQAAPAVRIRAVRFEWAAAAQAAATTEAVCVPVGPGELVLTLGPLTVGNHRYEIWRFASPLARRTRLKTNLVFEQA